MSNRLLTRGVVVAALTLLVASIGAPALAQQSSTLRGKVLDREGKPVAEAMLTFDYIGDYDRTYTTKTDSKGGWVRGGLPPGRWNIKAVKGESVGKLNGIVAMLGQIIQAPDLMIGPPTTDAVKTTTLSAEEVAKRNQHQAELEAAFKAGNDAFDAGNYDEALAKFQAITTEVEKCASCYAKIGDVYLKKNDADNAEKSFLKAIDLDPSAADAYNALASLYNSQKKFEEAGKMSAKGNELKGATGGDANSTFNQGIILWNQSKTAEAKGFFEKAIALDPKLADAHYWLGMAIVNEGKLAEAKKPFEEYLKLAPTGQYADTAKAILATIK